MSTANCRKVWYGLRRAIDLAVKYNQALVFCNGEASTVVGQYNGLAAFCMPGGENCTIPETLLQELCMLYPTGQIIVALDCDHTGRKYAPLIAEQFKKAGYQSVAADIGLPDGGDICDLCMLYEADVSDIVAALPPLNPVAKVEKPHGRYWSLMHANDLENQPRTQWLIQGILPDKSMTAIIGRSGEGKSFYALDLAHLIAQDRPVVYMAAEGQAGYRKRVAALKKHYKRGNGDLYFCMGAVMLMEDDQLMQFIEAIRELKPAIVFVDTVARTMIGGDENSSRDMGKYIDALARLQIELNCATVLVHHIGKSGVGARGSTVLPGACETIINISTEDDTVIIKSDKSKDEAGFDTQYKSRLTIDLGEGETSLVLVDSEKVITQSNDPLTKNQRAVLERLNMDIHADGEIRNEIEILTGLSHGSTTRALDTLVKRKFVSRNDDKYLITPLGKSTVGIIDAPTHATHATHFGGSRENEKNSESHESVSRSQQPVGANNVSNESEHESLNESVSRSSQNESVAQPLDLNFGGTETKAESYYRNGG